MSGQWGRNIRLSIFGESHGDAVGIIIDGLPSGIIVDKQYIHNEMQRRVPGKNKLVTSRKERDNFEILSGVFNDFTTGTPICAVIKNNNSKSIDYDDIKNLMRPGHADYTGYMRYSGYNDYRGGGHFSGRLTAPLVFAGAICKQILERRKKITIGSHIKSIGNIVDSNFEVLNVDKELLINLSKSFLPVINNKKREEMEKCIEKAREDKDSVGGIIETAVLNLQAGIGSPYFESLESNLAHIFFSIPGVKGVEFGEGFNIAKLKGSQANDEFYIKDNKIRTYTNNCGGIQGGISNGMPIIFRAAIKPTSSIGKIQNTIDINKKENTIIEINGRHDPCIVPRAVPVIDAVTAIVITDLLIDKEGRTWMS